MTPPRTVQGFAQTQSQPQTRLQPHPHCAHGFVQLHQGAHGFVQPQVIQGIGQPLGFSCFLPGQDACQDSHLLPLPSDVYLYERMSWQAAAAENRAFASERAASESRAASEQPPTSFRAVAQARPASSSALRDCSDTSGYGRALVPLGRRRAFPYYSESLLQRLEKAESLIIHLKKELADCKEESYSSKQPVYASERHGSSGFVSSLGSKNYLPNRILRGGSADKGEQPEAPPAVPPPPLLSTPPPAPPPPPPPAAY